MNLGFKGLSLEFGFGQIWVWVWAWVWHWLKLELNLNLKPKVWGLNLNLNVNLNLNLNVDLNLDLDLDLNVVALWGGPSGPQMQPQKGPVPIAGTLPHKPKKPPTKQNPNAWFAWQQNHHQPNLCVPWGGCAAASHTQGVLSPRCPLALCMALSTAFGLAPFAKDMAHHVPVCPPKALWQHQILDSGPNSN